MNPDGSHPRTTLAFRASDRALVLAGDVGAYNSAHGDAPVSEAVSGVTVSIHPRL